MRATAIEDKLDYLNHDDDDADDGVIVKMIVFVLSIFNWCVEHRYRANYTS